MARVRVSGPRNPREKAYARARRELGPLASENELRRAARVFEPQQESAALREKKSRKRRSRTVVVYSDPSVDPLLLNRRGSAVRRVMSVERVIKKRALPEHPHALGTTENKPTEGPLPQQDLPEIGTEVRRSDVLPRSTSEEHADRSHSELARLWKEGLAEAQYFPERIREMEGAEVVARADLARGKELKGFSDEELKEEAFFRLHFLMRRQVFVHPKFEEEAHALAVKALGADSHEDDIRATVSLIRETLLSPIRGPMIEASVGKRLSLGKIRDDLLSFSGSGFLRRYPGTQQTVALPLQHDDVPSIDETEATEEPLRKREKDSPEPSGAKAETTRRTRLARIRQGKRAMSVYVEPQQADQFKAIAAAKGRGAQEYLEDLVSSVVITHSNLIERGKQMLKGPQRRRSFADSSLEKENQRLKAQLRQAGIKPG